MNKRTEEKLKSIDGMRKAMTEILAQAWERGKKYGMLEAQESSSWIPVKTRALSAEIEQLLAIKKLGCLTDKDRQALNLAIKALEQIDLIKFNIHALNKLIEEVKE